MSKHSDLHDVLASPDATYRSDGNPRLGKIDHDTPGVPVSRWRIALHALAATLRRWRHNRAARRGLAELDARSLRDIGIAPELADYEAGRPFWRPVRDLRF